MMKIDCSKTVNYLKEKHRMTKSCNIYCHECPFMLENTATEEGCTEFEIKHSEKAIEIVQKWSDEHPQKTRFDDLLEKYPNADAELVIRDLCVAGLGYPLRKDCSGYRCEDCWNMPV